MIERWDFFLDHDASYGHYHLCPVCGKQYPTSSRVCPGHQIYYVARGTDPSMYFPPRQEDSHE